MFQLSTCLCSSPETLELRRFKMFNKWVVKDDLGKQAYEDLTDQLLHGESGNMQLES